MVLPDWQQVELIIFIVMITALHIKIFLTISIPGIQFAGLQLMCNMEYILPVHLLPEEYLITEL